MRGISSALECKPVEIHVYSVVTFALTKLNLILYVRVPYAPGQILIYGALEQLWSTIYTCTTNVGSRGLHVFFILAFQFLFLHVSYYKLHLS